MREASKDNTEGEKKISAACVGSIEEACAKTGNSWSRILSEVKFSPKMVEKDQEDICQQKLSNQEDRRMNFSELILLFPAVLAWLH